MRSTLLDVSTRAVNTYRKCQAFQLLQVAFTHVPTPADRRQEILAFMPMLHRTLLDSISAACSETPTLTGAQIKDLLKLCLLGVRQTERASQTDVSSIWRPSEWEALRQRLATTDRFKSSTGLLTICQQITQALQSRISATESKTAQKKSSGITITKRKADDGSGDEGKGKSKKIKRKQVKNEV